MLGRLNFSSLQQEAELHICPTHKRKQTLCCIQGGTTCVSMLSDLLYMAFASYGYEKQWIQQKNNEILSNEMDFHTDFSKQARLLQGSANKSVVSVCHLTLCRDVLECQDALTRYLLLQEQLPNITSCCCAVSQMQVLSLLCRVILSSCRSGLPQWAVTSLNRAE